VGLHEDWYKSSTASNQDQPLLPDFFSWLWYLHLRCKLFINTDADVHFAYLISPEGSIKKNNSVNCLKIGRKS